MSVYDSVVGGKLKLKGKALDVKDFVIKKKKKRDKRYHNLSQTSSGELNVLPFLLGMIKLFNYHYLSIKFLFAKKKKSFRKHTLR